MKIDSKHLNWGALSAVVALVAIAAYDFFVPLPGETGPATTKSKPQLEAEKKDAMAELGKSEELVNSMTWPGTRDAVGPAAMAWVSARARESYLDVSAFRPQRTISAEGLDQLNYLVTAEGPYPAMLKFVRSFESPESMLAVKALQLNSVDGASDTVRATITLVAYQEAKTSG
jgi:hypothetical protein